MRIIYPNYKGELPGARANFWHYEPAYVGWYIYGLGTVSEDGKQVISDPGVGIYEFTGAMINAGPTPPSTGPAVANTKGWGSGPGGSRHRALCAEQD